MGRDGRLYDVKGIDLDRESIVASLINQLESNWNQMTVYRNEIKVSCSLPKISRRPL